MPEPFIELLWTGPKHRLFQVTVGSHTSFRDFAHDLKATGRVASLIRHLPSVEQNENWPEEWKKLLALMHRATREGLDTVGRNRNRCKCFTPPPAHTRNQRMRVCEFKTAPYRVLFFEEEVRSREPCTNLIITHVFKKKQDETPRRELTRFADIRNDYYGRRDELGAIDAVSAVSKFKQ